MYLQGAIESYHGQCYSFVVWACDCYKPSEGREGVQFPLKDCNARRLHKHYYQEKEHFLYIFVCSPGLRLQVLTRLRSQLWL